MKKKIFGIKIMWLAVAGAAYYFRKPLMEKLKGLSAPQKIGDAVTKPNI